MICRLLPFLLLAAALGAADVPLVADLTDITARQTPPVAVELAAVPVPFAPAPPVGEHPRVLIGPSELPALRQRATTTAAGQRLTAAIRGWYRTAFAKPEYLADAWTALVDGDPDAPTKAGNGWWRGNLELALSLAAFDALLGEDATLGGQVAAALATLCAERDIPDNRGNPKPDGGVVMNVALAYDYAYGFMTPAQRDIVRAWIARGTAGRRSHGMDMAPEGRTYNWMPHGMMLVVAALAIEGEDGYDPTIYPESVAVMRDFLTYGVYPDGVPREGTHYFNYGMGTGGAKAMVAFAKRGDNLFGHPHYRALTNWYVNVIEPFGYRFAMHGDVPNDDGGIYENYVLMKYVWPDDPVIDFVWRNRAHDNYGGLNNRHGYQLAMLYATDWTGGSTVDSRPRQVDQWGVDTAKPVPADVLAPFDPARLNLPNSLYSPDRGILYTRTAWTADALALHFESKVDEFGPSHAHANRNGFTLSALGRKWAIEQGYGIPESKHHNVVLVDGSGQGFFCPAGRVTAYLDTPLATAVAGDAKYAYDWRYTFSSRRGSPENAGYDWEIEPLGPPADGLHTLRAPHNPVRRANRSAVLVRGPHPYVMIVDDIRKDDAPHLYEWLMQVPMDVHLDRATSREVVLAGDTDARLLVRFVDLATPASNPVSDVPRAPRLEEYLIRRSANTTSSPADKGLAKRLVVSALAVEPRFKVLLFPHLPDAELPTTTWDDAHEALTVRWPDQVDHWRFGDAARIAMTRVDGDSLALLDGINIARRGDVLYVTGRGWGTHRLEDTDVTAIHHDGSVASARVDGPAIVLTEAAR